MEVQPDLADLADLRDRVTRLERERAILQTLHAYAHAIDYGEEETWVDCFTADGVFDVRRPSGTGPTMRVAGEDELRAFIARHTRAPERYHKHLMVEPVLRFDEDTASVTSYFAVLGVHESEPVLRVFGRYIDRLVPDGHGRWRFQERIAEVDATRSGLELLAYGRTSPAT